jgi:hypothetical protein
MLFCWLYHTITIMIFDTHNMDVLALRASLQAQDMDDVFQALDTQLPDDVLGLIGSKLIDTTSFVRDTAIRVLSSDGPTQFSLGGKTWTMIVRYVTHKHRHRVVILAESKEIKWQWTVNGDAIIEEQWYANGYLTVLLWGARLDPRVQDTMINIMALITYNYMRVSVDEIKANVEVNVVKKLKM